ncbi:hypothetical protein M3J09_005529 [Ascochyta lentis]
MTSYPASLDLQLACTHDNVSGTWRPSPAAPREPWRCDDHGSGSATTLGRVTPIWARWTSTELYRRSRGQSAWLRLFVATTGKPSA